MIIIPAYVAHVNIFLLNVIFDLKITNNDIGKNVKEGKYKSLYIPIVSVRKDSDCNWENIDKNQSFCKKKIN